MIASVSKWGNSLAVRIPREAARDLKISEGAQVDLAVVDGALVVRPSVAPLSYDLDDLVAAITPENRHEEVSTGAAVGNEI